MNDPYEVFAQLLVRRGKLRDIDLTRTRRLAAQSGANSSFPGLLVKLGLSSERDVAEALAEVSGCQLISAEEYPPASPFHDGMSPRFLKECCVAGVNDQADGVVVAMADPLDRFVLDALRLACDKPVLPCVGIPSEIENADRL